MLNFISKILLFPFALLYGSIIRLRNLLYKRGFLGSTDFEIPVISVGNLAVGGTGKTPFVEMLIELLYPYYPAGVLSRGYKRKTSGYLNVQTNNTVLDVGDEPLQIKLKYPFVPVSVGEQRVFAIPQMMHHFPFLKLLILDDAFQHQSVRPDINILLTDYHKPFWNDQILPMGTLREFTSGKERANIIVVTKCPPDLGLQEQIDLRVKIQPSANQKVFFTSIQYFIPYHLFRPDEKLNYNNLSSVILLTGIADANPLKGEISKHVQDIIHFDYADHHQFSVEELEAIKKHYPDNKIWLTTEKDAVRLLLHKDWFLQNDIDLFCMHIKTRFIGENKEEFKFLMLDFLSFFYKVENQNMPEQMD